MKCHSYIGGRSGKALKVIFPIWNEEDKYSQKLEWLLLNSVKLLPENAIELTRERYKKYELNEVIINGVVLADEDIQDYIEIINNELKNFSKDNNYVIDSEASISAVVKDIENHPTLGQAMKGDEKSKWMKVIEAEMKSLILLETGIEVNEEDIPYNSQIVPTKIDLVKKYDENGKFLKYKARLVVLGNIEWFDEDDCNFYAPTGHEKSLKLLLSIAAQLNLKLSGVDVKSAFCNATIKKIVIYDYQKYLNKEGKSIIWKLKKQLYGLKSSPKRWYEDISEKLVKNVYNKTVMDEVYFIK
jgi:hypothetical protein